jgi:hypothetical protein
MEEREDPQAEYDRHQNELAKAQDERSKRLKIGKYTEDAPRAEERPEEPKPEESATEKRTPRAKSDKSG